MKNKLAIGLAAMVAVFGVSMAPNHAAASSKDELRQVVPAAKTHWLTTSSKIRHNKSCRYFKNSKGRMCTANEGRACKKCGG